MRNIKGINEMLGSGPGQIPVSIYKSSGQSFSLGGFTAKNDRAVLAWDGSIPSVDGDYLVVMKKSVGGSEYVYCVPKSMIDANQWPMFGGCFAYTSDSRFRQNVCEYPIPIHDRYEK